MYKPAGVNNSGIGINDNAVDTDNNDRIDRPGSINNGINTNSNISINKNDGGIDKPRVPGVNKSNNNQGKANANNINAKRAKFEEDVKKEPILQTILDVFDGELLG